MAAKDRYNEWLNNLPVTSSLYDELINMKEDKAAIEEAFHDQLSFGTAGLRGKVGVGTNRMNYYTVAKATQGIANYIKDFGQEAMDKGVVIAHDSRYYSDEFCEYTASILAANGIKAYVFDGLRPTPQLAYMIRYIGTTSGINITASHNPKEYNGYKVYWSDGCQVGSEIADAMYMKMQRVNPFRSIKTMDYQEAIDKGLIVVLDSSYDDAYIELVKSATIHDGDEELDLDIPLVYTPLNGAGTVPFTRMMKERGFRNFHIVPEQKDPDPSFATVGYPNPEDPKAFALSEKLGKEIGAELLMATDPDADRFAIEIRDEEGNYVPLNGNQTGYLLVNYILEGKKDEGTLPENGAMVKSIVTSTLSTIIAKSFGVRMFESLTGFKNICGRIDELTEKGYTYMFGYEESVGYACCPEIRDKDGISAGMLVAEAAAYYRKQGKSLFDVLNEIYEKYGYFAEDEPNIVLDGIAGNRRIHRMMKEVRDKPFINVAGSDVVDIIDYYDGYGDIPPSNVLRYLLANGSWFAIRPSGTEPKIKFYFYSNQDSLEKANEVNKKIKEEVFERVNSVK